MKTSGSSCSSAKLTEISVSTELFCIRDCQRFLYRVFGRGASISVRGPFAMLDETILEASYASELSGLRFLKSAIVVASCDPRNVRP
ncbi:hypothetical protein AVEN_67092-1 [Araneus ventricosus]|uniref:Uncharacterized protein n=1 Tax=Araneus ventricosus TaxID=182803 RepID=A0A4Y2FQW0_ARAVE|nr:hypothetical protein AVEN_67092-1 [Araneus ventricosus]